LVWAPGEGGVPPGGAGGEFAGGGALTPLRRRSGFAAGLVGGAGGLTLLKRLRSGSKKNEVAQQLPGTDHTVALAEGSVGGLGEHRYSG
jgi:hypothetical protein